MVVVFCGSWLCLSQAGDHVEYHAIGGGGSGTEQSTTTGKVVEVLTETQPAGNSGNTVRVSALGNELDFMPTLPNA